MTVHHRTITEAALAEVGHPLGLALTGSYLTIRSVGTTAAGRVVFASALGQGRWALALDDAQPARCARCGHDTPGDPSRLADGDHLWRVEAPLQVDTAPEPDQNAYRVTARLPGAFRWCSEMPETTHAGAEH